MDSNEDRMQYVNDLIESFREQEENEEAELSNDQIENGKEQQNGEQVTGEQGQLSAEGIPDGLATPVNIAAAEKPKKKKKKKKKTADLPEAGSELADDYKDKDKDEIEAPFHPERPVAHRMEYALYRYRKNHKFSEARKSIFDTYLRFGCVSTGPNAFMGRSTGADQDADGEMDFDMAKLDTDMVPNSDDDENLEVNFTEVARVYLGNTFISEGRVTGLQDFIDAPNLVDSFLQYLQIRNVCPEYADDIVRAREITALAKVELPMCKRARMTLPGNFNKLCAILFKGGLQAAWFTEASWAQATTKTQQLIEKFTKDTIPNMDEKTLAKVSAVVGDHTKCKVVDERENLFVRIVDIADNTDDKDNNVADENQEKKDNDDDTLVKVTLAEYENQENKFEIFVEKSITKDLRKDFVMYATMYQLNTGLWYLDWASHLMPSFYKVDDCLDKESLYRD